MGRDDVSYLVPLFAAAAAHRADDHFTLLPEPAAHSSLATDGEPLKPLGLRQVRPVLLLRFLMHVEALTKLVTVAGQIDPFSPWTLLRGALENFATAVWLLDGRTMTSRPRHHRGRLAGGHNVLRLGAHRASRLWARQRPSRGSGARSRRRGTPRRAVGDAEARGRVCCL